MENLPPMHKYPRTFHLEGSRLQLGDEDLDAIPFSQVKDRLVVVEEKMDGANAAISFTHDGHLLLQSRGHYLLGGPRERHFALFKQWAQIHREKFFSVLKDRYILYGEWLYAKHTCFYDALPHYFMEFDVYDRHTERFLATLQRHELLASLPIVSVAVLWQGTPRHLKELTKLVGPSLFKTKHWREHLRDAVQTSGLDEARVLAQTDTSDDMEGLYIKVEEAGQVTARLKYVRASFLNAVLEAGDHWLTRPVVANQLAPGINLWE